MNFRVVLHPYNNSCTFQRRDINYRDLTLKYYFQMSAPQIVGGMHYYEDECRFDRGVFSFDLGIWEIGTSYVLGVF
jgi:hypothetical protein